MPPRPFSPVKFSGEIDRLFALESRDKLPKLQPKPLNMLLPSCLFDAFIIHQRGQEGKRNQYVSMVASTSCMGIRKVTDTAEGMRMVVDTAEGRVEKVRRAYMAVAKAKDNWGAVPCSASCGGELP